jgi:TPP-dependent pyruvate/acetoin dehydrogenase alpha subunit
MKLDLVQLFSAALLTRRFEEAVLRLTNEGYLPPMLHPGAGQELSQLAALQALNDDDPLLYAHRGTAYMVGRGVSLEAMLSDMAGTVGGTNNGKGGIMHVVDVKRSVLGESGTLGGGLVIATGVGMGLKRQRSRKLVIHFFGDGGSNRGTFHESLNWSAVQKLPIIFICENNGWAVSTPTSTTTSVTDIADRAHGYGIPGAIVDGADPEAVYGEVSKAADRARSGAGPSLIEIKNVRLLGHYGTDRQDYREDAGTVGAFDPMTKLQKRLFESQMLSEARLAGLEQEIAGKVAAAIDAVKKSAPLPANAAFQDLYV